MHDLLQNLLELGKTVGSADVSFISDEAIQQKVVFVCRYIRNRAPVRFLLSCTAGKLDDPEVDIIKPYTEIEGGKTFSGRYYDEQYIQKIIEQFNLPCNATTAYLTPAFRNINVPLARDIGLVGRPRNLYFMAVSLLNDVQEGLISPENLFREIIRLLLILKKEDAERLEQLIESLETQTDSLPLSSEQIVTLIGQHLKCRNASRLPVLVVSAAYMSVSSLVKEQIKPLFAHTAADKQTGALGDVEITLENDEQIVTSYEMKAKRVAKRDIDIAITKIAGGVPKIDNYIFITTDIIEEEVREYAKHLYGKIGVEIVLLDCLGFLRHFLHFFHRYRNTFLESYQTLVLNEPTSSVNQPLKEAFLSLRKAAETEE